MSASSTRTAAAAAVLLAMLPVAAALAEPAPTSLLPPPAPAAGPVAAPREAFPEVTNPRAEKVQVQDLGVLDPNAVGVLDEMHGGLGSEMWAGTNMAVVQKVLPSLSATPSSRAMRDLTRRLLLSSAAVPAGKIAGGESLIKLRADKLWAMGELDGLNALLKSVPNPIMTPELRRMMVDTALLVGDTATACNETVALRATAPNDPFPAKLQVFCQFAAGKGNEAGFGLDVLREQKIGDPAFFAAADALAGIGSGKLGDSFATATPLTLAMARAAKLPLPESAANGTSQPALLRTIAMMPAASLEARLVAAEKAEAVGAVDTDVLRQTYESVTFTPQELAAPLADKTARSRALLYRAAVQQPLPAAKAEIVGKALSLAGDNVFQAARLYAPQMAALKPQPELVWFAYPAARALFAAGQPAAAKTWVGFARAQGLGNAEVAAAASALWPLARLTAPDDDKPIPSGALGAWRKARGDLSGEAALRRAAICYGLLAAFGEKVPSDDWLPLYDGPMLVAAPRARPALWQGLRMAAEDLRLGETVLLALASLGDPGLSQADPTDLYRVVAALRLLGLEADARALAVEAAIANGV